MHQRFWTGVRGAASPLAALALLAACEAPETETEPWTDAAIESDDQKASYAVGLSIGRNLDPLAERVDITALARGIRDAMDDNELAVPEDSLRPIKTSFDMELQQTRQQQMMAAAEDNQAAADSFFTANAERDGVITTESGLQYEVLEEGEGAKPGPDDEVTIHYHGTLPDGRVFDSSVERDEPATFGVQNVIPGFSEGLQLMSVGSKYRLYIPPELGYGARSPGGIIPPNATLIFDLELIEIVD